MNTRKQIQTIAGLAILLALCVVLTYVANYISIGPASINLSLIPIIVGAVLYGPIAGIFLGLGCGATVLLGPGMSFFYSMSVGGTILTCLSKTAVAGLVSSLVYRLINKKNHNVAIIIASLIVPIINTGMFIAYSYLFFYENIALIVAIGTLINFLVEFGLNLVLAPAIIFIIDTINKRRENR